jgi:transposase InsO family protein
MLEEWAYARPYRSEAERGEAFADWLHNYNHHRGHTALDGKPPASRVTNLMRPAGPLWKAQPQQRPAGQHSPSQAPLLEAY